MFVYSPPILYSVIAVFPPLPAANRITILQMDVETLKDGEELNDAIVDFYLK